MAMTSLEILDSNPKMQDKQAQLSHACSMTSSFQYFHTIALIAAQSSRHRGDERAIGNVC